MPFVRRVKYLADNTLDATVKIKDDMVSMGWVLHDDQASASNYYIFYSEGEDNQLPKVYVKIDWNTLDKINIILYLYWDNSTHTGIVSLESSNYFSILADDDGIFYLWIYGDKNFVSIITNYGDPDGVSFGAAVPFFNYTGVLQSAASSGSNVVLTLNIGEADSFKENYYYQIVGIAGEGRDRVQVVNVNKGSNQITIGSLPRNYGVDSIIGIIPWPWIILTLISTPYFYNLYYSGVGTADESSRSNQYFTLIDSTFTDPDQRTNEHMLIPYYLKEYSSMAVMGYINNYIMKITVGVDDDIATSGELDKGTSSGSNTSTSLNDTTKSWEANEWENKCLAIINGVGSGQIRKISTNSSTDITIETAWTVVPDNTSEYIICLHGWRIFYFGNVSYRKAIMEV